MRYFVRRMQKVESSPLVSIIIPVYNAGNYIAETINSVHNQSYTNWELILINDGSKDNSAIVIQEFLQDPRITYYYQDNAGVSTARNIGIKKCRGKYIAFLDADDLWLRENLEMKVSFLESDGSYGWVYSDMLEYRQATGTTTAAPIGRDDSILENILLWEGEVVPGPCSNLLIRQSCVQEHAILFDNNLSTAADQDFCLQLARYYRGKRISVPLFKYRVISTSMSRNIAAMEKDHLHVYKKAIKQGLFRSLIFRQRCLANLYFILSANWWQSGKNKPRGIYFAIRALLNYPPVISRYVNRLLHAARR